MIKRILVIDDEDHIRENLKIFLGDEGYIVFTAKTLNGAKEIMREPLDFVVIDLNLNDGNSLFGGLNIYLYFLRNRPDVQLMILSAYPYEWVKEKLCVEVPDENDNLSQKDLLTHIKKNYINKGEGNYIDNIINKIKRLSNRSVKPKMKKQDEDLTGQPDEVSQTFHTHIYGHIGSYSQGSSKSIQHGHIQINDSEFRQSVESLLDYIKEEIHNISLSKEDANETMLYSSIIETNIKKDKPNNTIITESLKSIRSIFEGCAGSALATGIIGIIDKLI